MENYVDNLQSEWGEFLGQWPWSWFTTNTFRYGIHPEAALKLWRRWINQINRNIFGVRYSRRPTDGVIWVCALEYQKREVIHFHSLIGRIPNDLSRSVYSESWNKLAGFAKIVEYDENRSACYYLSKYLTKGGEIYFDGPLNLYQQRPLHL